jgi:hypothetical protein
MCDSGVPGGRHRSLGQLDRASCGLGHATLLKSTCGPLFFFFFS